MSFFVNTMVCGFSLYQILAFFLIYSCLGWCLEVIYAAVSTGQLVNRGFLNGPVCPIYGFGMIIVLFTLSPLADNLLLLYLGGVILPSVLELVGGWALYKLYHTRWWDYSDFPFNIGGYICLEFSLLWGVGTVVVMKAVHPVIAGFVEMVPQMVGFVLMCILYACYAADVVVTAFAASDLARELDALEKVADSMHAVSDAMTELLGTTAMDVDQKMDESRLQLKLAAAEARDNAAKLSPRDAAAALRAKADEAMEAARKSSQEARLNASEAATAVKLAAKGTAERTAELLRLEQLAEELQARSEEMRARTRSSKYFGKGRMLRAYPKLRHGEKHRSLDELRERLKYERRNRPCPLQQPQMPLTGFFRSGAFFLRCILHKIRQILCCRTILFSSCFPHYTFLFCTLFQIYFRHIDKKRVFYPVQYAIPAKN